MKQKETYWLIVFSTLVAMLFLGTSVFADSVVTTEHFSGGLDHAGAYGSWDIHRGRLYQADTDSRLAKINFEVPQSGLMEYRFDVRYEDGGMEDRMGGFGVHFFVDDAYRGRSWGNGESYLFWLNYDDNATYGKSGFQAQIYKSSSFFEMDLLEDYQAGLPASYLTRSNLDMVVPVRIQINGYSGLVKIWDPTRKGVYFQFYLDQAPGKGNYIAFRTNSLSVSFDNLVVSKVNN